MGGFFYFVELFIIEILLLLCFLKKNRAFNGKDIKQEGKCKNVANFFPPRPIRKLGGKNQLSKYYNNATIYTGKDYIYLAICVFVKL